MQHSLQIIVGAAALVGTGLIRAVVRNHVVRSKLRLSLLAFGAYLALYVFLEVTNTAAPTVARIESIGHLLLALGAVTLGVVLAVNPWRQDRIPDHFPNIVQDAIIIGLFMVVATFVMEEKFLTTSAVGAVVIGFALQDTLGHLFAGLALQVEKPFRVGHWIKVGSHEGIVTGITWRATALRTKSGDAVIVPNNIISKEAIFNYSEPAAPTRLTVDVGVSYDAPPDRVKAVIAEAIADAPLVLASPAPDVIVADFGSSSITYRVRFWIDNWGVDDPARDQVRTCIYYAFKRAGIEIPFPITVNYYRDAQAQGGLSIRERTEFLAAVDLFRVMPDEERREMAELAVDRLYGAGQTVVREGRPGDSMFVVCRGMVRVTVGETRAEVATIGAGGFFGEMSLLTGDVRSATVSAATECALLEIGASDFRRLALAHPEVLEAITTAVERRRAGLEDTRGSVPAPVAAEDVPRTFLARVQQFLRLPVSRG